MTAPPVFPIPLRACTGPVELETGVTLEAAFSPFPEGPAIPLALRAKARRLYWAVYRIHGYRDPHVAAVTGCVPSTLSHSRTQFTPEELAWLADRYDLPDYETKVLQYGWSATQWLRSGPLCKKGKV